jgi:arylsulfatase A-like enzyme
MMDLFSTALAAADIPVPEDRVTDGRSLLPLLAGEANSPHQVLFGFRNEQLCTASDGRWKLHLAPAGPNREKDWRPDEVWVDPRRPDGVRILAPYEQAHPSQYPGLKTGDSIDGVALFNLANDAGEQHNVASQHPEIVERLRKAAQAFLADVKR